MVCRAPLFPQVSQDIQTLEDAEEHLRQVMALCEEDISDDSEDEIKCFAHEATAQEVQAEAGKWQNHKSNQQR
jgi:predicted RNase H-like HicB family nuclease